MILFNSLINYRTSKMFHLVQKWLQRAQTYKQSEIVKQICFIDPKLASSRKEEKKSIVSPTKIRLWGWREEGTPAGDLGPMEQQGAECPGFSFCLIWERGGEEASYPKMPKGVRQKRLCSFKGPRKEQHRKTENFYTITTALQPKITDKTVAHPYPWKHRLGREP